MTNPTRTLFYPRFVLLLILSNILVSQSSDDLKFLEMLPDNQASSIYERLGIPTGKPINDEVQMEDFDSPSFNSLVPKSPLGDSAEEMNFFTLQDSKIFGLDLFKDSPSTFAPIDLAPAPLDYVIGPGDEFKIQFFGNLITNRIIPVNREGNIVIPEIGSIEISGLNFSEAKDKINALVDASLIGVSTEISLAKIRSIQIFVLGNAYSPGAYTVSSLSNISNVLFFSGGPTVNGSLRNISVKRIRLVFFI